MSPMDRRAFMKTAGTAAVVGTVPLRPGAKRQRREVRKSLKFGMIRDGETVRDKFAVAKDCGFAGVEMDAPSGLDPGSVVEAAKATGITIPGVVDSAHWKHTLSDPDPAVRGKGRAALETAVRDCRRYGGSSVLLVPAVVNKQVSYVDAYRRSQEEIRTVLPLAAELEVTIAIENVWNNFLLSPIEAARYLDELESPWVGWHFDVGNVVNYGWPEQWIRTLGRRIVKLDVKEFSRAKRDAEGLWKGFQVELLEGDCDWPAVMKALDDVGYEGWATLEVSGGDARRLSDLSARLDRIIAS